jgi:hypothetical protein
MGSVRAFERDAGKHVSLVEWGQHWYECSRSCGMRSFPAALMQRVRDHGAVPVLSWGSYAENGGVSQPAYRLAEIARGRYDRFIAAWARGAARWGHPFFLRFDWEMNTNEVPYSEHANGNRPGQFAAMWRHVHAVVVRAGATNVLWVWCPNVEYPGTVTPLRSLYPGDATVDWTCLDGYNWGAGGGRRGSSWTSPAQVFGPTYGLVTGSIAPSKPLMIGETASSEHGGSKPRWISDLLGTALSKRLPRVRALVWFDKRWDGMDWPITTSRATRSAFRRAIAARRFVVSAG